MKDLDQNWINFCSKNFLDLSSDLFFVLNDESKILYANTNFCSSLGFSKVEQVLGLAFNSILHYDSISQFNIILNSSSTPNVELVLIKLDKKLVVIKGKATFLDF